MMIPARITPSITAITLRLKSQSRIDAARVPVQAPVPGRPVLKNADKVLVNRIVYNASSPKRGDIIVFKPKGNESSHYYTKRIVGLPGETVQIVENWIYINGEKLEEDYTTTKIDTAGIAAEKVKLGGDEYFVMGDNRKNSEDSRSADIGAVKRSYIYGKAWFVVSPKKNFGFVR